VAAVREQETGLRRELGLGDLVLAQVLCVVGSSWVGIAAKLGRAQVVFWLAAMVSFYLALVTVVIWLNRLMPLEGGLYQWAKQGFGEMAGFLTAWNLWVYAVIAMGAIVFVVPTDLSYTIGPRAAWLPANKVASYLLVALVVGGIVYVAVRGLAIGKWMHNIGSVLILLAYAILLTLPWWALARGRIAHFDALPWQVPKLNAYSIAIFGEMTVGALSGFEYVAILAGETRNAGRSIGRSVVIATPVIALMFILGTSSVLAFLGNRPVNVIGPIPQTLRLALGESGAASAAASFAIFLVLARAVAAGSLIFTGLTRLPMTAGWDNLVPRWFIKLHPKWRTPVNSIYFVAALVMGLILLSMLGVREQEASQTLTESSIALYAIAYAGLFAIPLFGARALRARLPWWVKTAAAAGLLSSLIALIVEVYPIVNVVSRLQFATKICSVVVIANMLGIVIYRAGQRR
jgi:amino acid transporter